MKVKTLTLTLVPDRKVGTNASKLRGFFATRFNEYTLLHQHNCDKVIYMYPLVQYKILKGVPIVIGINEGVEVLQDIYNKYDKIKLDEYIYEILEKKISFKEQDFGISDKFYTYSFETPWFALNQENFTNKYQRMNPTEQKELLQKTLIGNILSMSKSLGYTVPSQIKCEPNFQPGVGSMKGVKIATFKGEFMVNFLIPDYFGLGKSVSRGFGTVKRCNL